MRPLLISTPPTAPTDQTTALVSLVFPDALAPIGHVVRLQRRDYQIKDLRLLADGQVEHQLRPC
ncbi:hypothetical protein [Deinococcus multiflagellatus]|uniref:Uncharacterized protein n=1 Tax=Deinococcus multiflagellatus TaxID=1656887 RepID=A0ABW1ZQX2_9DEIO|nr:hypothetical protein [Deinococcus multiflagellatus]MBZ9715311.1 hypothetical protein [Deinococcus multiflagellatus]